MRRKRTPATSSSDVRAFFLDPGGSKCFGKSCFTSCFLSLKSAKTRVGGGACGTRISVSQKEIISKQVKRYRNTAMSKGDIIRAVKTVYGYDQEAVEELVNEVW